VAVRVEEETMRYWGASVRVVAKVAICLLNCCKVAGEVEVSGGGGQAIEVEGRAGRSAVLRRWSAPENGFDELEVVGGASEEGGLEEALAVLGAWF